MKSAVQEAWERCDKIDTLFVIFCTCICWTIVPTVGIAYGGYTWRRNGLSAAIPAVLVITTCSIQWWILGYTLSYGEGGSIFGDFTYLFHRNVLSEPVGTIPAILFSEFQLVFEATVCALAIGGISERGRLLPAIPFIFVRPPIRSDPGSHGHPESLTLCSYGPHSSTTPWRTWSGAAATSARRSASWTLQAVRSLRIVSIVCSVVY